MELARKIKFRYNADALKEVSSPDKQKGIIMIHWTIRCLILLAAGAGIYFLIRVVSMKRELEKEGEKSALQKRA